VALIAGDRPDLTCAVMERVPSDVGVVFKLENAADIQFVESRFRVEQTRPSSRSRPSIPPGSGRSALDTATQNHDFGAGHHSSSKGRSLTAVSRGACGDLPVTR
jgi:hypothetical protein